MAAGMPVAMEVEVYGDQAMESRRDCPLSAWDAAFQSGDISYKFR